MGFLDKMKQAQQQAQEAMGNAGGMGGGIGGMGAEGAAYAQKAQKLAQSGLEAPGVIHSMQPTGQTDIGGGQEINFDVSFRPEGAEPVATTITQSMLPAQMEGLSDGKTITVRYDPDSPTSALIYSW